MLDSAEYVKIFVGLLAIVNPVGAVPLFIAMTGGDSDQQLHRTVHQVAISVLIILLATLFLGDMLLEFFGISIASFRVGGGILILLMAIAMLHARTSSVRQTREEAEESIDRESVGVVPLAMPLLAGPGAISAVIMAAHRSDTLSHHLVIALGILLLSVVVWGVLRLAPWIADHVSATGINISTRIMGLVLAAIAVEFIADGLKGLFPTLG
ncbi:MAG TPA: YchE family NAAT transporter [Gammaproteobacteria bacterium]|nr:YchE family NAAT transporter [Gammaproteobacteria bacterium]